MVKYTSHSHCFMIYRRLQLGVAIEQALVSLKCWLNSKSYELASVWLYHCVWFLGVFFVWCFCCHLAMPVEFCLFVVSGSSDPSTAAQLCRLQSIQKRGERTSEVSQRRPAKPYCQIIHNNNSGKYSSPVVGAITARPIIIRARERVFFIHSFLGPCVKCNFKH